MKICLTCLFVCLSLSSAVLAQDQGPLLVRFPYRPETREEPVFNLRQLLSEVRPTVFSPQNYTLPDHILFSPAEQVWVDQLREGFDLVQDGDFLSAKDIFTAFLEEYPEHVPSRIALADILYSLGDLPAAEAAYRALLSEYPNHFQALNNLAWMYSTSTDEAFRRPDEARELVRRAMVTAPQSHHVWSTLSQTLFAQGRFEEAAQAAATAVNLAQRGGAATDVLVNYLLQLDRTRAAIQATGLMN
ncbi:MAG: tetratricopeptide repeat protein [Verrucomicrobia bacterium]|nr:tetratricopeptide repeat protein [Verrucomicrobiota bacterium]MCH8528184.1 tetratricopeptide repeat protein [Kiritimatiellia bacterium]